MSRRTSFVITLVALVSFSCGGPGKEASSPNAEPPPSEAAAESNAQVSDAAPVVESEAEAEPTTPECSKDSECTIFADCCTCKAVPANKPLPESCESVCGESPCDVRQKTIDDVYCDAGRCKLRK